MKRNRMLSLTLALAMALSLLPPPTLAAEAPQAAEVTLSAHENCSAATTAATLNDLRTALGNAAVTDIVLDPATSPAEWPVDAALTVDRTVHIYVADGETVTLKRGTGYTGGSIFTVTDGGALILGNGALTHDSASLTAAAQAGDYEVTPTPSENGGRLFIDGGAAWTRGAEYTQGATAYSTDGKLAVFYNLADGKQYIYTNAGAVATASMIVNEGALSIWPGVTLQNAATTGVYGSAVNGAVGSTLNLYGGTVTMCAAAGTMADRGIGAIYLGDLSVDWQAKPTDRATTFNMYGGSVTNNSTPAKKSDSDRSYADGGGIAMDTATMNLYGGSVSYNHGGMNSDTGGAGDGGGIMVRCGSVLNMYGGSVDHNYTGGYGGGIMAWNGDVNIHGGSVTENRASYGAGIDIASSGGDIISEVTMTGGTVAHNEAIVVGADDSYDGGGYGGGICAGSGNYPSNAVLDLSGGTIMENRAIHGGGLAVYASSGTYVDLSGDFEMTGNFADQNGNGMYLTNVNSNNTHALVLLAGGARIDTNNPVYFENLGLDEESNPDVPQIPVRVTGNLTTQGTAAIFEFSDDFWNGSNDGYAHPDPLADEDSALSIVSFDTGLDVQENKIALESSDWYLKADGTLDLQSFSTLPQYTIRNGTAVTVDGVSYYRLYSNLADAFDEAASGDTLYIFYNTTITEPAVLETGKNITLLPESFETASMAGTLAGNGTTASNTQHGYRTLTGPFLLRGSSTPNTPQTYTYNTRGDYTITLSSMLALGESGKYENVTSAQGAIVVNSGATLTVGQTNSYGATLTFDGNLSYPKEGPMFQTAGSLTLHSGVTIMNHSNYSLAHPGVVEVAGGGSFTMNGGSITGNVSPVAGAVYVAQGGSFTMDGGSITGNTGAMPRYGFDDAAGGKYAGADAATGYDTAFWGQPKYYLGAGGVYNEGAFTMNGGDVLDNCGQWGGVANIRGSLDLRGGTIRGNHAHTNTGATDTDCDLSITGYDEGANPAIPSANGDTATAGWGGGVYVGHGSTSVTLGGVTLGSVHTDDETIPGNTAEVNGGGLAFGPSIPLTRTVTGYTLVDEGDARETVATVSRTDNSGYTARASLIPGDRLVVHNGTNALRVNNNRDGVANSQNFNSNSTTAPAENMLWTVTDDYRLAATVDGAEYYLIVNNTGLDVTEATNGGTALTYSNNRLYYTQGSTPRYVRYTNNGGWGSTTGTYNVNITLHAWQSSSTVTMAATSVDAKVPTYGDPAPITPADSFTATVSGAAITGNTAGKNGGGLYTSVPGALSFQANTAITKNTAGEMGGGLYTSAVGTVSLQSTVTLSGNTAKTGGGVAADGSGVTPDAAAADGSDVPLDGRVVIRFDNTITGNTAKEDGGGAYVKDTNAVIQATGGKLTDNTANRNGGGAALADGGHLFLTGAEVNNNHLTAAAGKGHGVYDDGNLVLAAANGVQPWISYHDVLYLAEGRTITLHSSYNVAGRQSSGDKLTVDSAVTANDTPIFKAANDSGARAMVGDRAEHLNGNLSVDTENTRVVELNSVHITYWDEAPGTTGKDSGGNAIVISTPSTFSVAPNADVIAYSFVAASANAQTTDDDGFDPGSGRVLSRWLLARKPTGATGEYDFKYLTADFVETDNRAEAKSYLPGDRLDLSNGNIYLIADYNTSAHNIYYLNKGAPENSPYSVGTQSATPPLDPDTATGYRQNHLGSLIVPTANYSLSSGRYTFTHSGAYQDMDNALVLTPTPVTPTDTLDIQGVLREFDVYTQANTEAEKALYEKLAAKTGTAGYTNVLDAGATNETKWIKIFSAEIDEATGRITGITTYQYNTADGTVTTNEPVEGLREYVIYLPDGTTVTAAITGDPDQDPDNPNAVDADVDGTSITYQQPADSILVTTWFKQAMVELKMAYDGGQVEHLGYYDTHHQAFGVMAGIYGAHPSDADQLYATLKLLAPYAGDLTGAELDPAVGADGELTMDVVDMGMDTPIDSGDDTTTPDSIMHYTLDLNGYTMDMDVIPQLDFRNLIAVVKNGVIRQSVNTNASGTVDSVFSMREGSFTAENLRIVTAAGTPYSIYAGTGGELHVKNGCDLGNVFLAEGATDDADAYIRVDDDFDTSPTGQKVAIIWLNGDTDSDGLWNYNNDTAKRMVFKLGDGISRVKGNEIRSHFALADANTTPTGTEDVDNAAEWFIGTDGMLHRKAQFVIPQLLCENCGDDAEDCVLDHYSDTLEPNDNGYPVFGKYRATYGFNVAEHTPQFRAVIVDPRGNELNDEAVSAGEVRFLVNAFNGSTYNRLFGFSAPMDSNGTATTDYTDMGKADVTRENRPYIVSATWYGEGEYAPQYAGYWNYNYGADTGMDGAGVDGSALSGVVHLHMNKKPMSDETVVLQRFSPTEAGYIGPQGALLGYTSSPTLGNIRDTNTNQVPISGVDYIPYQVALSENKAGAYLEAEPETPVTDDNGIYYPNGIGPDKHIYYTNNGGDILTLASGDRVMTRALNGAPAGFYSVEIAALDGGNYTGLSGNKGGVFEITPYSGRLLVTAPNHVVVLETGDYDEVIDAFFKASNEQGDVTVFDTYGNRLNLDQLDYGFATVSGSATLVGDYPASEGLYNLVVKAKAPGVDGCDPNYSPAAAGYTALLVTNQPLDIFVIPNEVSVPYTGEIYTDSEVKKYDAENKEGGYTIWKIAVNAAGVPLDADGNEITVDQIPTSGNATLLTPGQYRLELGTPQHIPLNADRYTMVVTDTSGKHGLGYLRITDAALGEIDVDPDQDIYTGAGLMPNVTVKNTKGDVLISTTDYVLTVHQVDEKTGELGPFLVTPQNAGRYAYQIRGINNYTHTDGEGSANPIQYRPYTILPKDISNRDNETNPDLPLVTLDAVTEYFETRAAIVPVVNLYYNGMVLSPGTDYTVTYDGSSGGGSAIVDPGQYDVTITGVGNYRGTIEYQITVHSMADSGDLSLHVAGTYDYNGKHFNSHNWWADATISIAGGAGTVLETDPSYYDVVVSLDLEGERRIDPDNINTVADAGLYFVKVTPNAAYRAYLGDAYTSLDRGYGITTVRINRAPVTVTVAESSKTYGETDPDLKAAGYETDLAEAGGGFYSHDNIFITGTFSRDQGEDARNIGYVYAQGSFTAGGNYIITMSTATRFRILPKDVTPPADSTALDLVEVQSTEQLSYTGYGQTPIRSVVYTAPLGSFSLYENAHYVATYRQWSCATHGVEAPCTPLTCTLTGEEWEANWGEASDAMPVNVGWYRVTVDADNVPGVTNNYVGKRGVIYQIVPAASDLTVNLDEDTVTYNGLAQVPNLSVLSGGFNLDRVYYKLGYSAVYDAGDANSGVFPPEIENSDFIKAGAYVIIATGTDNYAGSSGQAEFTIEPKSLAQNDTAGGTDPVAIALVGETFTYDGDPKQAAVTVQYYGKDLVKGADYTLSYANHVSAGTNTATVTVTGIGNFTGSRTLSYTINPMPLDVTVINNTDAKVYGTVDRPFDYTLTDGAENTVTGVTLTTPITREAGEEVRADYDLALPSNSAGPNYTLTLKTEHFAITPKSIGDGAATPADKISVTVPSYVSTKQTFNDIAVAITYWAETGTKDLVKGDDYTVTYYEDGSDSPITDLSAAQKPGAYRAVLTAAGSNYTGSIVRAFQVVEEGSFLNVTATPESGTYTPGGINVELTAVLNDAVPAHFEVTGPNGTPVDVTGDRTLDAAFTAADAGTYLITATYISDGNTAVGTTSVVIRPKDIGATDLLLGALKDPYPYTGSGVEVPGDELETLLTHDGNTLVPGTHFLAKYANNVQPSPESTKSAVLTLHGVGNYTGTRTVSFAISETRFRVTYHDNGAVSGTAPVDGRLYGAGEYATVPNGSDLLRGDHVFYGWSPDQVNDAVKESAGLPDPVYRPGHSFRVEADTTLYAVWAADENGNGVADLEEDRYYVTYDRGSGTGTPPTDNAPYPLNAMVVVRDALGRLTKDGYTLLGWTKRDGEAVLDTATEYLAFVVNLLPMGSTFLMENTDVILHPVWGADSDEDGTPDWEEDTATVFYIYYDGNGGAGSFPPQVLEAGGTKVEVNSRAFTRINYVQVGWTTNADEAGNPGTVDSADDLTVTDGKIAIGADQHTFVECEPGTEYYITNTDPDHPNPVIFYALWAEDMNNNSVADYTENRYTVAYENRTAGVTAAGMTTDTGRYLAGLPITLADAPTGTYDGGTAYFLGWTRNADAAGIFYGRNDRVADGVEVYAAGQEVPAPSDIPSVDGAPLTFYPLWGAEDYDVPTTLTVSIDPEDDIYTGAEHDPAITVLDGSALVHNDEYDVTYRLDGALLDGKPKNVGVYTVTITGKEDTAYEGYTATVYYTIRPATLTVTSAGSSKVYGQPDPAPAYTTVPANVTLSGALTRVAGEDKGQYAYDVTSLYDPNGNYTLVHDADSGVLTILPKNISDVTDDVYDVYVAPPSDQAYTGSAVEPQLTIVYRTAERALALEKDTDYTATYSDNVEAGEATVTVTGKGNYTGTRTVTFNIVTDGVLAMAAKIEKTYNRSPQTPTAAELAVKGDGKDLTADDYTVTYTNLSDGEDVTEPTNAGVYLITVTGNEGTGYAGRTARGTLIIQAAKVDKVVTDPAGDEIRLTYNGTAQAPDVISVHSGDLTLTAGEYDVTYRNAQGAVSTLPPTAVGAYTMVVTGTGNFAGSVEIKFSIGTAQLTVGGVADHVYDGMPYQPRPSVARDGTELTENVDYTLTYDPAPAINAGDYTVTVTGKGNYTADANNVDRDYTIKPKALDDSDGAGRITVTVTDAVYTSEAREPDLVVTYTTANGRTLYLTRNTDYTVTYTADSATGASLNADDKPLTVGAYTVTITAVTGSNYAESTTAEFRIIPAAGKSFTVTANPTSAEYNGEEQDVKVEVTDEGGDPIVATDYDFTFIPMEDTGAKLGDNDDPLTAGTYTVSVAGKGDHEGYSGSALFVVTPATLTNLTLAPTSFTYDGTAREPNLTVTAGTLQVDPADHPKDYAVYYENNVNAGTATVTVVGKGNTAGVVSATFTITPATLTVTPGDHTKVYGDKDPVLTYTVSGKPDAAPNPTFEGALTRETGEAVIVGGYAYDVTSLHETSGNYTLALAPGKTFTIKAKELSDPDVTKPYEDEVTIVDDTFSTVPGIYTAELFTLALTSEDDYTLTFDPVEGSGAGLDNDGKPAGDGHYDVTVDGTGNYAGSYSFRLRLVTSDKPLDASLDPFTEEYNGQNHRDTLGLTIVGEDKKPLASEYYTIAADTEIIDVGTYTITVTGVGKEYENSEDTVIYMVTARDINNATVTVASDGLTYTGSPLTPAVTVEDLNRKLVRDEDYTVTCSNNVNAGTATVTVTGIGNYTGSVDVPFTIAAATLTVGTVDDHVYDGTPYRPKPAVTSGDKTLTENVDYTLAYSSAPAIDAGDYTVTVTGTGNYRNEQPPVPYTITPKALDDSDNKGKINVTVASVVYTSDAQQPPVVVVTYTTADGRTLYLTGGTDYDLDYTNAGTVTLTGKDNYEKGIDTAFTILPNTQGLTVTVDPETAPYNGEDRRPTLTVMAGSDTLAGADYTATYSYNGSQKGDFAAGTFTDVGVYVITVTGNAGTNYDGATGSAVFTITPASFTVNQPDDQDYTGAAIEPKPSVTSGATVLEAGTDYVRSYANNVNPGTATITVTGIGNYAGQSVTVEFNILGGETYTVTYDGNEATGGAVPTDDTDYLSGSTVHVLSGAPVRAKAVFLGWVPGSRPTGLVTTAAEKAAYTTLYHPGDTFIITANVTLYALWAKDDDGNGVADYEDSFTVEAYAGVGGSIQLNGSAVSKVTVSPGGRVTVTITEVDGYELTGLTVNGREIPLSSLTKDADTGAYTYTIDNITANHSVNASFTKTVTIGGGGGGGGGGTGGGGETDPGDPPDGPDTPTLIRDRHFPYVQGTGEGQFSPNATMTRAEVAMILARLMTGEMVIPKGYVSGFPDVDLDAWYYDAMAYLEHYGILKGYPDGTGQPLTPITRGEFAAMVMRFFEVEEWTGEPIFSDLPETHWAYDYICSAHAYGFVLGYTDGTFGADQYIRRAEAVTLLNRALDRVADEPYVDEHIDQLVTYSDVAPNHWAYYIIIEASNGHNFTYDLGDEDWVALWANNKPPAQPEDPDTKQ